VHKVFCREDVYVLVGTDYPEDFTDSSKGKTRGARAVRSSDLLNHTELINLFCQVVIWDNLEWLTH